MKIEFIEFYPQRKVKKIKDKEKISLGTVHIYLIEEEMDIRGISVVKSGKGLFFRFPHFPGKDEDTNEKVMYPHVRFTNDNKQKEMLDFLHKEVKPIIEKTLSVEGK